MLWFVGLSIPFFGWMLSFLVIPPLSAVLWLLLMFKAYQGERFKLPFAGDIARAAGAPVAASQSARPTGSGADKIEIVAISESAVLDALRVVRDPDLNRDIVVAEVHQESAHRRRQRSRSRSS